MSNLRVGDLDGVDMASKFLGSRDGAPWAAGGFPTPAKLLTAADTNTTFPVDMWVSLMSRSARKHPKGAHLKATTIAHALGGYVLNPGGKDNDCFFRALAASAHVAGIDHPFFSSINGGGGGERGRM